MAARPRRAVRALCVLAALLALRVGAGVAAATPSDTPSPAPSAPAGSESAAPETGADSAESSGDEIKYGTPKEGQLNWEEFGGDADDAPKTLDEFSDFVIGTLLTGFGIVAVMSGMTVCGLMIVGVRGRSTVAKTALESSIWLWVGLFIGGSFSSIGGLLVLTN